MISPSLLLLLFSAGAIARSLIESDVGVTLISQPDSRLIASEDDRFGADALTRSDALAEDEDQVCFDPIYRKRTLKLIKESPFIGLFHDLKGETRFEASGINIAQGAAWVIFDNLRTLGKISLDFKFMGTDNVLISEAGENLYRNFASS